MKLRIAFIIVLVWLAGCVPLAPIPTATPINNGTIPRPTSETATPVRTVTATPLPPTLAPTETSVDPTDPDGAQATRVRFGPGETSTQIQGNIDMRGLDRYILQAQAGQLLSIEITSPNQDVLLTVIGEDGSPLKRYQNGPPVWTARLRETQDYIIHAVSVGPATAYTLTVWTTPLSAAAPERIQFDPGAIAAQRDGLLPSGTGVLQYMLAAQRGQTLSVDLISQDVPLYLVLETTADGVLTTNTGFDPSLRSSIMADNLPADDDYVITVYKPDHTPSTPFTLTVTIE